MVNLIICGGGYKGFLYLGGLHYLINSNKLKNLEKVYCSSIGTFICTLFIIGYKPTEVYTILLELNFSELFSFQFENITKKDKYCMNNGEIFNVYKNKFSELCDKNITLKEFYEKYNIDINIATSCLNSRSMVLFNHINHPDVKILDAAIASCAIPIMFSPVKIGVNYYIDGDIFFNNNYIQNLIDDNTITFSLNITIYNNIDSFENYVKELILTMLKTSDYLVGDLVLCFKLPEKFEKIINFSEITNDNKVELFYSGIKQSEEFYKTKLID
jgi:predicted acylesterase/phospholipase RssA